MPQSMFSVMARPPPLAEIVARADRLETRIEVYTASLLVIDEHSQAGALYLNQLATALQLPEHLVIALRDEAQAN